MIIVITTHISSDDELGKKAYIEAKHEKFESILKAGYPDRDKSEDTQKRHDYIEQQYQIAISDCPEIVLYDLSYIKLPLVNGVDSQDRDGIVARAHAFKEKVNDTFPLITGENLLEDVLGFAGNQIFVKQMTNLATLYFTDETMVIDKAGPEPVATVDEESIILTDNEKERAEALERVLNMALKIGKGVSAVVPPPFKTVLSGVFEGFDFFLSLTTKPQHEKDNELLIQRIAEVCYKAAWDANIRQTVTTQAGRIFGIVKGMARGYGPQKEDGAPPDKLERDYLMPYYRDLNEILGILSLNAYAEASLPEYCLAATTLFSVLQELAVLDTKHTNPFDSKHCKALQEKECSDHRNHVMRVYTKLQNDARELVEKTTEYQWTIKGPTRYVLTCPDCPPKGLRVGTGIGWFYDNAYFDAYHDGFQTCICLPAHDKWASDLCYQERKEWILFKQSEVYYKIQRELGGFYRLAESEWGRLLTHPLYGAAVFIDTPHSK